MKTLFCFLVLIVTCTSGFAKTHDSIMALKGPDTAYVTIFSKYVDDSITIFNPYSTYNMNIIVVTNLGTNITGNKFYYSYVARDTIHNILDTVTRIVVVKDKFPGLTITLKGAATATICRWAKYTDPGYIISGGYGSTKGVKVDTIGDFYANGGTQMYGNFTLGYEVTDSVGNTAISGYRYINVLPISDFICLSGIAPDLPLEQSIHIFPNPSTGIFSISTYTHIPLYLISIYNLNGQLIKELKPGDSQFGNETIDLNDQASGVYFVHIQASEGSVVRKIVLSR